MFEYTFMHPVKYSNNFYQVTSVLKQYQELEAIKPKGLLHSQHTQHTVKIEVI